VAPINSPMKMGLIDKLNTFLFHWNPVLSMMKRLCMSSQVNKAHKYGNPEDVRTAKELEAAYELRKAVKKGKDTNNYAAVYVGGEKSEVNNHICYSQIDYRFSGKELAYFVDYPTAKYASKGFTPYRTAQHLIYIHWLANESPYAEVFVTKDAKDILENGVIFHTHMPCRWVLHAAIQLRNLWEYPFVSYAWMRMKNIIGPEAAMILAMHFDAKLSCRDGRVPSKYPKEFSFGDGCENHGSFSTKDFNFKSLKPFMEHDLSVLVGKPFSKDRGYSTLAKVFGQSSRNPLILPEGMGERYTYRDYWNDGEIIAYKLLTSDIPKYAKDIVEFNLAREK